MVGVIIGSKRLGINPDNVATPMAASFGDLITLALLACFSQWFYSIIGMDYKWANSNLSHATEQQTVIVLHSEVMLFLLLANRWY